MFLALKGVLAACSVLPFLFSVGDAARSDLRADIISDLRADVISVASYQKYLDWSTLRR